MNRSHSPSEARLDPAELYAAEQRHFWFRHRCRLLERVIGQLTAGLPDGFQVLEVGCGTGSMLQVLERACHRGHVTGCEPFAEGLAYARTRVRCPVVQGDVYDLPFPTPFDVIGMFDVLEHLAEDERALRCLAKVLRPGGRLVLTVPAHQSLWSYADVASGHFRRYSAVTLRRALQGAGFEVDYVSQFMAPLYPLMRLGRAAAALCNRFRRNPVDPKTLAHREFQVSPVVNAILDFVLRFELPLLRRQVRLPVGTSLIAVARPRRVAVPLAA